jgi:hypothetical protein
MAAPTLAAVNPSPLSTVDYDISSIDLVLRSPPRARSPARVFFSNKIVVMCRRGVGRPRDFG